MILNASFWISLIQISWIIILHDQLLETWLALFRRKKQLFPPTWCVSRLRAMIYFDLGKYPIDFQITFPTKNTSVLTQLLNSFFLILVNWLNETQCWSCYLPYVVGKCQLKILTNNSEVEFCWKESTKCSWRGIETEEKESVTFSQQVFRKTCSMS
jgi:hypothetical protein